MTQPAQPAPGADCWILLNAVIFPDISQAPDTLFGHGTSHGSWLPVDPTQIGPGSARYDVLLNLLQVWDGTAWHDQPISKGDEYVDLDTGVVYTLNPSPAVP